MRLALLASLTIFGVFGVTACPSERATFDLERGASRLQGRVVDDRGAPLAGVTVRIGERSATTSDDGSFVLDGVPFGSSVAELSKDGHGVRAVASTLLRTPGEIVFRLWPTGASADVVFSGDVMFARRYLDPESDGRRAGALTDPNDSTSFEALVRDVAPLLRDADLTVPNVETPFGWSGVAHPSKPFVFLSPPTAIAGLAALGADVAALANNHTWDFFDPGMRSTLDGLRGAGIETVGAGMDDQEAYRPLVLERNGVRIGFAAFCGLRICGVRTGEGDAPDEPPYQDATPSKGGVAKVVDAKIVEEIEALRASADRIVVLLHAGNEYVQTPTDGQRNVAHRAIDLGADLVVGHHPHVLQPFEVYRGKLIAYSLGNLVFDQDFRETWDGAVLRARMDRGEGSIASFTMQPVHLEDFVPHPSSGRLARHVIRSLAEMSAPYGVTILEDGSGGRVVLAPATSLPGTDRVVQVTPTLDEDGAHATVSLEELLPAGSYVSAIAGTDVEIGRDVLRVGSFEHELAGAPYDAIGGWNPVNRSQHLIEDEPKDGDRALQICRDLSAPNESGLYSAGRHRIAKGATYSFCGCSRGHAMARGTASVVYWQDIAADAPPLASMAASLGAPTPGWTCGCTGSTPPDGATFVNVRLEAKDATKREDGCSAPDQNLHCADWDAVRLIEWERLDAGRAIPMPNDIEYVRVPAARSGEPITVTIRAIEEAKP